MAPTRFRLGTSSQQSTQNLLKETDLHPFIPRWTPGRHEPGGVDLALNMAFDFNSTNFFVSNATFDPPPVPVLLQILSGKHAAQDLLPPGSVYALPSHSSIEITFPATARAPHSFYMHGHVFAVVRSAGSSTYNYRNSVWRDTISTGTSAANDNVTIRFRTANPLPTENPGPWFLHCHIDFHLQAGFAVALAEEIPHIPLANPVPHEWSHLCPVYNALAPEDQ